MRQVPALRAMLFATCAMGALAQGTMTASAGGFGVREQSTEFQGMSFAGNATSGGGLSGMFWNPAVAAYAPAGIYTESHYAGIIGRSEITADPGTSPVLLARPNNSGDIAKDAVVPSSYMSYRLTDRLVMAMSVNSPFGLVTEAPNRNWSGYPYARTSEIKTYNFSPTLAYRVTPTFAIGVGLQIEHIEGRLKSGHPAFAGNPNAIIAGDDTSFGFTAGVNWTPVAGTHIGLGYRSAIDHTLEGTFRINGVTAPVGIKAGVTLPEIVTLSLRQVISPNWTVLGSVEWTNWSRVQKLDVICTQNPAATCAGGQGSLVTSLPLGWHDGWMFSLGAEHKYSQKLTLRTGIAYEISPIQNPEERSLRVPDADRIWLSAGATYAWSDKISLDLAYTHIFVDDALIRRTDVAGLPFVGHADSQVDIISGSLKIKLGD